ncbi:PREDICTED: uncharacterized protein LOC109238480 [Nicotiana attenuata]|uniref:uncharacterized protein LOC109238480 n=1 Tax=Nicotiana attenuata TaxID=49451 RepID=UPI00090584C2|nr:PREDICTED: uncharacterized protein LOC109238480 [Nicotiana attenuata]
MVTVRSIGALAAASRWFVFQMDVHNKFLQGDLSKMFICKFLMAFQARGSIRRKGADFVIVLVYVDDLLVTGSNLNLIVKPGKNLQSRLLEDRSGCQRIVRRLLYLTMTRPGIAFVVQVLSQLIHAPKQSHIDAAMRIIRYIKGNPGLGLFLPSIGNQKLKQGTVSRSLVETEFRSMATTVAETKWLVGLFEELGVSVEFAVQLHCDSKAAIQIAAHPIFHE